MIRRHHFLRGLAAALALGAAMPAALAQSSKPIRLVVPFPAGGATDLFARTLSQKMGEKLGTSIVVDNNPGAGGSLGSDLAAKASWRLLQWRRDKYRAALVKYANENAAPLKRAA